jgi:uncharacterized protein
MTCSYTHSLLCRWPDGGDFDAPGPSNAEAIPRHAVAPPPALESPPVPVGNNDARVAYPKLARRSGRVRRGTVMGSRNGARLPGSPSLYAAASHRHGRGVFAGRRFRKGEVLEHCPILAITAKDRTVLEGTRLRSYLYERDGGTAAIALGFGSLYNHSFHANAECELLLDEGSAVFRALRAIAAGEEITIRYTDESQLWFVPREGDEQAARTAASNWGRATHPGSSRRA